MASKTNGQTGKKMPVSGVYQYGSAEGKPASQGKIQTGEDLRSK